MSVKLSVVIVNYNSWGHLQRCLKALADSILQPEIIVVDNDGSAEHVNAQFPHVRLLTQSQNQWFCGGNNIGIAAAQGDYVLLLNPDTAPQPDALQVLVDFMDENLDYRGATLQLRYPNGQIQRTCSRIPTYPYLLLNHTPLDWLLRGWRDQLNAQHWYMDWDRTTDQDIKVMPGSCLMMRRRDLSLTHDCLLYFPEDDLAQRFKNAQFRFLSATYITHHEKSVTQTGLATRVYYRDLLRYVRRYHGAAAAALLWALSRPLLWGMGVKCWFLR